MQNLRKLSQLEDEISQELNRATNRLREQLHRFFPQLVQLSESADEPWLWTLFEQAPFPAQAARLSEAHSAAFLQRRRIRRLRAAAEVRAIPRTKALGLAPGTSQVAAEHAFLLLPRLRLLHRQRTDLARRISALLEELTAPAEGPCAPAVTHMTGPCAAWLIAGSHSSYPCCEAEPSMTSKDGQLEPAGCWPLTGVESLRHS